MNFDLLKKVLDLCAPQPHSKYEYEFTYNTDYALPRHWNGISENKCGIPTVILRESDSYAEWKRKKDNDHNYGGTFNYYYACDDEDLMKMISHLQTNNVADAVFASAANSSWYFKEDWE